MPNDSFARRNLAAPPAVFGAQFLSWLGKVGEQLDVAFVDDTPMPRADLDRLVQLFGKPHAELAYFYSQCTPWWAQRDGVAIWKEHTELMWRRAATDLVTNRGASPEDVRRPFETSPALWPVNVSQNANVAAFSDRNGRLVVLDGNIGEDLGRPFAIGLRNYFVMAVVAEIIWEETGYQSYDEVMNDERVLAAGAWPGDDLSRHPLRDAYEARIPRVKS